MRFFSLIILLLLSSVSYAATFSVGVSPGIVDVGELSPGDTKIVKFSIFSISDEPLLVYLSDETGRFEFFSNSGQIPNLSEESTEGWIEFLKNPVEIDPEVRKAGRGWIDINVLLHVPENAEPGYHVIYITPTPRILEGSGSSPVDMEIVAIAKISVIFIVKGEAKREGVILDATAGQAHRLGFNLKTFFQNTGTLTLYARARSKIYDRNGTFLGEFYSAGGYVKPKGTQPFETQVQGISAEGEYRVESNVTFTTGQAEKISVINLYAPPVTGEAIQAPTREEFPLLLALIILIVIIIIVRWLREKRV